MLTIVEVSEEVIVRFGSVWGGYVKKLPWDGYKSFFGAHKQTN